jgi:hypothetical protein
MHAYTHVDEDHRLVPVTVMRRSNGAPFGTPLEVGGPACNSPTPHSERPGYPDRCAEASFLLEVPQVGRRLAFLARHQHAIGAAVIVLTTDLHPHLTFLAIGIEHDRPRIWVAAVILHHAPWARQCVVDNRDLVMHQIAVGRIEIEPFLDDALIVPM